MTDLTGDRWGGVNSVIELDAERFAPNALAGLEAFSQVEVVFFTGCPAPAKTRDPSTLAN